MSAHKRFKKNSPKVALSLPLLPLDRILPRVDVAGYFQYEKGYQSHYRNPSHHFILVESGCIEAWVAQERFEAKAGALICFRPADLNEYRVLEHASFYQAHITLAPPPLNRCTPFFPGIGLLPACIQLGRAFKEMREQFETFCLSTLLGDTVNRMRIQAAVFNMFGILAGVIKPAQNKSVHVDEWERIRWRLVSEDGLYVKIGDLARDMGLSPRHFDRMFCARFGCPPKEYQMRSRLNEIKHRLCGTDAPIKVIAAELGFANLCSMSRMTRRILGVSPSDLRHSAVSHVVPSKIAFKCSYPDNFKLLPPDAKVDFKRPYPINLHLVPPGTSADWWKQFMAP